MKYYIPTTSMNFNCILSSESVSPVGFYQARGFGYSRWFAVPENDQEGAILLYSKPFSLKRPKSDQEDHPMMIEIDTDEKFRELGKGVFACDHTIYMNSLADKIILFDEKDKDTVLSLSDSSLETKMVRFYKKRIFVSSFEGEAPDVSKVARIPLNLAALEHDQRINKIKGLLFGYYIGALLSADPKDVAKLNAFREIQNIFSAIASSERRSPTETQSKRLVELFSALRRDEPIFCELVNLLGDESRADSVIALARKYGHVMTSFDEERLVRELAITTGENPSQRWVKTMINSMDQIMLGKRRMLPVGRDEIVSAEGKLLKVSEQVLSKKHESQLFLAWINEVLSRPMFNGKISIIKESLSDELTIKAKDVLGEEWKEGNPIKSFMNDLRRHVRGASFDRSWDNGVLSSMAAVLLKGDNWDNLLYFMQANGMTDYRLAFGFYGMLNGFANLTRDFTDILIGQDAKYLIEIYREFYGQLHGVSIRMPEANPTHIKEVSNVRGADPEVGGCDVSESTSIFNKMLQKFCGFKIATRNGVSKDSLLNALNLAMAELKANPDPNRLLELLIKKYANPYGWKKTIKPWKELKKYVEKHMDVDEISPPLPGFDASATKAKKNARRRAVLLRDDHRWIDECARMIVVDESRRRFCEDAMWFLENKEMIKEGDNPNFDVSNAAVISRFESYLEPRLHPSNPKMMWMEPIYKKIPVTKIIAYLRETYV